MTAHYTMNITTRATVCKVHIYIYTHREQRARSTATFCNGTILLCSPLSVDLSLLIDARVAGEAAVPAARLMALQTLGRLLGTVFLVALGVTALVAVHNKVLACDWPASWQP